MSSTFTILEVLTVDHHITSTKHKQMVGEMEDGHYSIGLSNFLHVGNWFDLLLFPVERTFICVTLFRIHIACVQDLLP